MPNIGSTELLIIVAVLVLLFGATKLPKLARSMGESARIFKAETKGLRDDEKGEGSSSAKENESTSAGTSAETKQLPDSKQQQEPLVAETVEDHETDHRKTG